jgi:hypothetical protein
MYKYCKLKNGEFKIVWSDNIEEETMDVYDIKLENTFNTEFDSLTTVNYSDVLITDYNYSIVKNFTGINKNNES